MILLVLTSRALSGSSRVTPCLRSSFNIGVDSLTKMVTQPQENGLLKGLPSDLIPNGVSILQYVDDIIPCFENNPEYDLNLNLLLYLSELSRGLKINFL